MARPRPRAFVLALVALATVAIVAFAVMPNGLFRQTSNKSTTAASADQTAQEPKGEDGEESEGYFDPRKEAKFERVGGEADRVGPDSPAAEQVNNRAYPRSYVDDKRALKGRKAFDAKPKRLHRADFRTAAAYQTYLTALAAAPGAWNAIGPVNTDVPGESGQFFDLISQTGPSTTKSGGVAALAIDPNCGKASAPAGAPCRLWVAAAGGGIWRTNDALAATPAWIAPPNDLPTNSFGS